MTTTTEEAEQQPVTEPQQSDETKTVARVDTTPVELDHMTDLDEAFRMAKALAQSALMPDTLRNKPNDVLVTVLYGRELELRPMQAIQSIHVIKGKPFISGQLWLSLVRRAGHRAEVSGDDKSATCTITRGDTGETHTETFTIEQAKTAKLTGNADSNWSKYPDRMNRWRAVTNCARMICPEVALGFQALEEQVDDAQSARPSLGDVASQRETVTVDKATGEVIDAEVVPDDDAVRDQVRNLEQQATAPADDPAGPTPEVLAELNAEADADLPVEDPPSELFRTD